MSLVVNSFYKIPKRGKRGQILILKDGFRSGKFIYKGVGRDDGGTIKNGWHRIYKGAVDIRWFGAIGNNRSDNTDIIQYIFNKFDNILIPKGEYLVKYLEINSYLNISGNGTLKALMPNKTNTPLLEILNPAKISGITIDGAKKIAKGIEIDSRGVEIDNILVKGIYSYNNIVAVGLSTYQGDVIIKNSAFEDIFSQGNNYISDSFGAARAIAVGAYDKENILKPTVIKNCKFNNIFGEEGDCIVSQAKDINIIKRVQIKNCQFSNFSRRAIKLMASSGSINNCKIINNKRYKNLFSPISAFGNDYKIENNFIDTPFATGINLGIDSKPKVQNYIIKNNTIKRYKSGDKIESFGIQLVNIVNAIIENNKIYRNAKEDAAIALWACKNVKVTNNKIYGGVTSAIVVGNESMDFDENILIANNSLQNSKSDYFIVISHTKNAKLSNNDITNSKTKLYYIANNCQNISTR